MLQGIHGLLQVLNDTMGEVHLSKFRGKRIAVDTVKHQDIIKSFFYSIAGFIELQCFAVLNYAMGFLQKSLLALMRSLKSSRFVFWCLERIELLIQNGITPIMVFDGN